MSFCMDDIAENVMNYVRDELLVSDIEDYEDGGEMFEDCVDLSEISQLIEDGIRSALDL